MTDFALLDLAAFRDAALGLLAAGVEKPPHPLHTLMLATVMEGGAPRLRAVVPRGLETRERRLLIHTDIRSAKIGELRHDPRASVLGWDHEARVQVRLQGRCQVHYRDAAARQAWEQLRPGGREIYRIGPASGALVAAEADIEPRQFNEDEAFDNFALIVFRYDSIDALFLGEQRHRRMRCDWKNGTWRMGWVVP